ncbi:mast cell protease 4-like [Synchiropus splendidus]|uniref:mast cell protease 4-like n=1 Tax=Synchiropus splendidus TaxID=270530 RepID=UPI00237E1734|nr:mast cell protease 4-like [Synchiropus splendidus]
MVVNKSKAEAEAEKCSQLLTKRTMLSPSLALLVFIFTAKSGDGAQIIGGTEVTPHSLPYMALVEGRGVNGDQIFCGGTLIHPKWVLSAAHCAGQEISVTLGVHSRENEGQGMRFRQFRRVSRQVIHPGYLPQQINDLMLLELQSPVEETAYVKSSRINTPPNYPGAGKTCLVAGWGLTGYGALKPSDVLMAANVKVIDLETCNSADCYGHSYSINKDVVCAGSHGRNQIGVWKGDSGGPLVCDNMLVGVTSFGKESCPGVFMYLSQNRVQWIQQTIK